MGDGFASFLADDLSTINVSSIPPASEIIHVGIGTQFACYGCGAIAATNYNLIPITVILRDSIQVSSSIILGVVQDVVALEVYCSTMQSANAATPVLDDSRYLIQPIYVANNVNSSFAEVRFAASDNDGNVVVRQCDVIAHDYRALSHVKYNVNVYGRATRNTVIDISPVDSRTCMIYNDYCLNLSSRRQLSYYLLYSIFGRGNVTVDQGYATNGGLLPDPTLSFSDAAFQGQFIY